MDVVRWVLEFGDVERVEAGTDRLGAFLLYSLSAVHQVRLHVRVCNVRNRTTSLLPLTYLLTYLRITVDCPLQSR